MNPGAVAVIIAATASVAFVEFVWCFILDRALSRASTSLLKVSQELMNFSDAQVTLHTEERKKISALRGDVDHLERVVKKLQSDTSSDQKLKGDVEHLLRVVTALRGDVKQAAEALQSPSFNGPDDITKQSN